MSTQDAFARILASSYDAMLDETRWPATSALIDEACGLTGNGLMVGEGPKDDERIPRFRQLPARRLVHITDLYTAEELKTSPTYNELLPRAGMQDSLNVRLPGLDGSHIGWGLNDPVDAEGWGSSRIAMVQGLLPHIQQFVRVRQALVRAEARITTVTALLDNPRIGVLELDRRGRILAANDRAHTLLRHGDGLVDRDGMLRARAPADQVRLERLVGDALPASGAVAVSGSMVLRRSSVVPPFVVPVKPVGVPHPDCSGSTRSTPSRGRRTWCGWCRRSPSSGEGRRGWRVRAVASPMRKPERLGADSRTHDPAAPCRGRWPRSPEY